MNHDMRDINVIRSTNHFSCTSNTTYDSVLPTWDQRQGESDERSAVRRFRSGIVAFLTNNVVHLIAKRFLKMILVPFLMFLT